MISAVCSPVNRGLKLVTLIICSALQKCCMKRVRTLIWWIITNGRFITISFPHKILYKVVLFISPRCVPVIIESTRNLRPVSGVVWDRGWKIMPAMVKWFMDTRIIICMSIFSFPLPCVGEISILSNKRLSPMRKGQLLLFLRKRERRNSHFFSVFPNGRIRKHYACLSTVNNRK